jgi:hypothetical protein
MHGQAADQPIECAFAATDAYRLPHAHGGFEQALRHFLRQHVIDADIETQRTLRGPLLECVEQLTAHIEDLVRVREHQPAYFSRDQLAPRLHQELLSQPFLERAQLGAHRGR